MASYNSVWIKYETLKMIMHTLEVKENKGEEVKGIEITVELNDTLNQFQQNVSAYVSQTKEDREAKKDRFYIGNGKTYWSNGAQKTFKDMEGSVEKKEVKNSGDLPF